MEENIIVADVKELLKAASKVSSVINNQSPMPIIQNLLIESNEEGVFFYGTNLDASAKRKLMSLMPKWGFPTQ